MKKLNLLIFILLFPLLIYSQNIDLGILKEINLSRNKQYDEIFRAVTDSAAPIAFGIPILLLGIGIVRKHLITRKHSLYILASVLSAAIITSILKYSLNWPRPFITYAFIEKITSGGSPTFPSGHSTDAFAFATAVCIAYPKWYIIVPVYAWAIAVGYSRMDLGVHYPSDVLMGAIIGAGSAYLCYKGQQWLYKTKH
jgi:membrane-associated phospholipid phosphatase